MEHREEDCELRIANFEFQKQKLSAYDLNGFNNFSELNEFAAGER
jgi:hypothetical protein